MNQYKFSDTDIKKLTKQMIRGGGLLHRMYLLYLVQHPPP